MQIRGLGSAGRNVLAAVVAWVGGVPDVAQPATVPLHEFVSPDAAELGFSAERLRVIGATYADGVAAGEIPGAVVMISRDGTLVYSAAVGYRDLSAEQPLQIDSRFYLASMTKPLTTVAAMMLVEEGRLLLDDPVAAHIPEFATLQVGREITGGDGTRSLAIEPLRRPLTIRDLMRHTSGLTYGPFGSSLVQQAYTQANVGDFNQTNAELVTKLAALPLAYQPGEVFEYSMSTDVLGRVVEVVSGLSLADFIELRITGPLEMADTSFNADDPTPAVALAGAPVPFAGGTPRWLSGGGGMVGTAADYLRFGQMLLGNGEYDGTRLLSPESIAAMTSNQLPPAVRYGPYDLGSLAPTPDAGQGFGYGFAVRLEPGRNAAPGSVGDYHWAGSSGTYFWIDPQERLVAVVFTAAPLMRSAYRIRARQLVYQAMIDGQAAQ